MRLPHPNFRVAQAAKDSPIRTLVEAQAEQRSDILKTKADLQSADGFTARAHDFPAGNSLTAAAATTQLTLANAPAGNHLYEAHFKVTITPVVPGAGTNTHKVVVAVEVDAAGVGSWVEQYSFEYEVIRKVGEVATAVVWPSERLPVRVAGLTSASLLRLKIKSASGPGGWSFAVHGFNLATDLDLLAGVTYHTGPAIDFLDGGGATLADVVTSKLSLGTSDGVETDLGGPALSPDVAPFIVGRTVWGADDSYDIAVDRFTAQLNPCVDGVPGNKNVAFFICQPWALKKSGPIGSQNAAALTELLADMVPLCDPVRVPAGPGTSAQDYIFSFYDRSTTGPGHTIITLSRKPRPKSIRPEWILRDGNQNVSVFPQTEYDSSPVTFWFIWAVQADGSPASNVGWARDSGVTEVVNGSRKMRTVRIRRLLDRWYVEGPSTLGATLRPAFRCKIECGTYAAANLEYTGGGNQTDLGAAPTETVEFAGVASVPDGTAAIFEVRNDADSGWIAYTDGQTAAEIGVSQRQTYKVRCRMSPNSQGDATPTLWEIGPRDVKKVWLSDLVKEVRARHFIPDVAELVPAIPEAEFVLIKNGEQEFNDRVTKLLSTNTLGSLALRVWRGVPDRPRNEWFHREDYALVDDYDPRAADVSVIAHSPLVFVNGALPVYNTTTQKQEPLQLANKTPKQVYEEIVNNQLSPDIPARFRGDPLLDESCLITQTLQDTDGLTVLNAIEHIAGCVLSTDAGRLKSFPMFGPGAPVAFFPSEKIRWRSTAPGLRQRVPRFYVKYDYDSTSGEFRGMARLISGNDILATNLKPARIDAKTELRDDVCRWIPNEELAKRVGQRRVDALGAGLLVWPFYSEEAHAELVFGSVVAVQTERFFARDPSQTAQRALKGALWAIGRIVDYDVEGHNFAVWIQSYTDIFGSSDVASRLGFSTSTVPAVAIRTASAVQRGDRLFIEYFGEAGVGSVKIATNTSAFPAEGTGTTVNGQDGISDAGAFVYGNMVFVTITTYPSSGAAGVPGRAYKFRARLSFIDTLIDEPTGKPKRTQDYTDGAYALKASATDGLTADSAVKDSAARAMNLMFGKSSDDLDDVTDGPSFKRVGGVGSDNKATNSSLKLTKTRVILSAGSSWNVPSDFNPFLNSIELIGGGGSGAPGTTNTNGGGGGGGGEYRRLVNFDPAGLTSIPYAIGAGSSSSSPGGDTSWNNGMVVAKGGSSSTTATGAAGGTGGTGGDGKNGGTGGNGSSGTGNRGGGGGGGAAGPHSVGNNGAAAVGATAGAGGAGGSPNGGAAGTAGGGVGGDGTTWDGTDGPGGGGGGGNSGVLDGGAGGEWGGSSGGGGSTAVASGNRTNGKNGVIVITYYAIANT